MDLKLQRYSAIISLDNKNVKEGDNLAKKIKIGFYDSGVGGISVMAHAKKYLPDADYIYYADTEHVPYGTKTKAEIIGYSDSAVNYLTNSGVDAIVVACNTATSMAIDSLRAKYSLPIIGMEPAVKPAASIHPGERVLVCATPATIAGEKLHSLIEKTFISGCEPTLVALPELVTFAEKGIFDKCKITEYLSQNIDESKKYAAVVLGCTHFSYFKDSFKNFLGNIDIIDGTEGTVNRLLYVIGVDKSAYTSDITRTSTLFVRSGNAVHDTESILFFEMLEKRAQSQLSFK